MLAETQFFVAPVERSPYRLEEYLVVSPVELALGALSVALILLLTGVVASFLLNLVQLTDTIVLSNPFALYASLILLGAVVLVTRRSYVESPRPDTETDSSVRLSKESKWLTFTAASAAGVTLALPWATENSGGDSTFFRGFEFLLNQHPTGHLINYTTYAFSPAIFRDVRIQVTIAVVFLIVCVSDAFLIPFHTKPFVAFLHQVRRFLAVSVLAMSVYYLAYMTFLKYESIYWVSWLDKLTYQGSANAKGYSMMFYDPSYGFWTFLGCSLLLVWLSFSSETGRPVTWVRQLALAASSRWKSLVRFYKGKRREGNSN